MYVWGPKNNLEQIEIINWEKIPEKIIIIKHFVTVGLMYIAYPAVYGHAAGSPAAWLGDDNEVQI